MKHHLNRKNVRKLLLERIGIGIITAISATAIDWQLNHLSAVAQSVQTTNQTIAQSATPAAKTQDAVIKWNGIALELIRTEKTPPGMAARNLAMLHTAMYDAVNAIAKTHKPYQANIEAPTGASEEAAATASAHRVLAALYPKQVAKLDAAKADTLKALTANQPPNNNSVSINLSINPADIFSGKSPISDPKVAISRPQTDGIKLGETVADRILATRQDDGVDATATYTPINQVGNWQPVPPDFKPASLPQWKTVKPFSMTSGSQFRIAKMPSLISPEYLSEFRVSKDIGAKESKTRTPDQTVIAKFWLDGTGTITPPGRWNQIAADLAVQRGNTLQQNARLFALLNIALADASIIDADQKYTFNRWRPVTAIQQADKDNNARTIPDPNWTPLLSTPSSPAYVSGHSVFGGAADVVLTKFFGKNTSFTTNSDPSLNLPPRSFKSFSEAAEEAGMSRVYGGVHWLSDNRDGLAAGRNLGKYVVKNLLLSR
jgi:membrane-associated phospholipid phosphatase